MSLDFNTIEFVIKLFVGGPLTSWKVNVSHKIVAITKNSNIPVCMYLIHCVSCCWNKEHYNTVDCNAFNR